MRSLSWCKSSGSIICVCAELRRLTVCLHYRMWSTDKDGICATTHFNLTVWDWDRASAHDLIGTCVIPATAMFRVKILILLLTEVMFYVRFCVFRMVFQSVGKASHYRLFETGPLTDI